MIVKATYKKRNLKFNFVAKTSRGSYREKDSYYVILKREDGITGIGEASPLKGLSVDYIPDFEDQLEGCINKINNLQWEQINANYESLLSDLIPDNLPSVYFAFETAILDLKNGGRRIIFPGEFAEGKRGIEINGLIWMGDLEFMLTQITQKIYDGFRCIKIKIGSLDFERECDILKYVRSKYYRDDIEIRVDANGAFKPEIALERLDKLYEFDLHSIEQPVKPGQWDLMRDLCKQTPVPIVLDEELIGISSSSKMRKMLEYIRPQYIILKPMLLGGFAKTKAWIKVADSLNIGWWMTSALESNIGLNAITQFTDLMDVKIPQGLGTGQLYDNNIDSPLKIVKSEIRLSKSKEWELDDLLSD